MECLPKMSALTGLDHCCPLFEWLGAAEPLPHTAQATLWGQAVGAGGGRESPETLAAVAGRAVGEAVPRPGAWGLQFNPTCGLPVGQP